jgi:ribose 5-phosphate isomerase A
METSNDIAKKVAGHTAADLIKSGMLVGLGTGSTAAYFIDHLAERCREGLKIRAVATSNRSFERAKEQGIPMIDIDQLESLDVTVDGADEIDLEKRMIKGGGGALLREKIVASMSREMIVVVDSSKVVTQLGKFPLPIEISQYAWKATIAKLKRNGFFGQLRNKEGKTYITDGGNYIYDITFPAPLESPEEVNASIRSIPGVLDTGFFFSLAKKVLIGYPDGTIETWP